MRNFFFSLVCLVCACSPQSDFNDVLKNRVPLEDSEKEVVQGLIRYTSIAPRDLIVVPEEKWNAGLNPSLALKDGHVVAMSLNRTDIESVSALIHLPYLKRAYLSGNRIDTLDGLSGHPGLEFIDASNNRIAFVAGRHTPQ